MSDTPRLLRRQTTLSKHVLDEEIDYCLRAMGYARQQSLQRLRAWGTKYPWVAKRAREAIGDEFESRSAASNQAPSITMGRMIR